MGQEQRRLVAILAADVVGFSRLASRDEPGTLARLAELRRSVIDPQVANHTGRVFKTLGDGFLIEFLSPVQAVNCALEIQKATTALPLRIGVHLGDVVVDGDDLMGDGVNVAKRLEGIAEPGGVAISRQVHDQVHGKVSATFEDKGEKSLKNLTRPVHVYTLADGRAASSTQVLALPDKPSIAVLPFQNMSGDPEQDYFADGIVEDIITALSRFRELFVIARNSTFTYKERSVDVRQVAHELGVRYVLEGSSRKAGDRVRVTAQLIDCETGSHLWAERYDRALTDIFAVQEEITRSVVACIAPAIEASMLNRIGRLAPANLTAHELATRALSESFAAYLSAEEGARNRALALARRALEIDDTCARAWSVVAAIVWQSEFYSGRESTPGTCREGFEAARRAIALDRLDHSGYTYKGLLHLRLLQYDDALADLRQAQELNPNDATVLHALAYAELMNGDAQAAKAHCLEVLRLNPRDPRRYNACSVLANVCFVTGDYAEGLKWVAESKREHPDFRPTIAAAIKLYVGLGRLDLARAEADLVRSPHFEARVRAGLSNLRRPEHRERENRFFRMAFGFDHDAGEEVSPPALALPDKPSIAVLPFQNMSGDPEQDYFADGIVEDIITALSRFKSLFVIARNSSFTYKGRAVDIKQVGRELGVRYVLEGSVRKAGSRVRITGQLIDSATGSHLWADNFDGLLEDVFELQDRVSTGVVAQIAPKLEQAEIDRVRSKPTESLDAYDHLLRGIASLNLNNKTAIEAGLKHLYESIRLDPGFAAAYGWAAIGYSRLQQSGWLDDRETQLKEGARLGRKAIELGKDDAFALGAGGFAIAFLEWDFDAGLTFIDRALRLNPNLALVWQASGWVLNYIGNAEKAIEHLGRAMRLSPLDPDMAQLHLATAIAMRLAGRYEEAIAWANKALHERPNFQPALVNLCSNLALAGRVDEAREIARQALRNNPDLRISKFNSNLVYRRPEDRQRMVEGLKLGGIPE